jgi:hypothetical protein
MTLQISFSHMATTGKAADGVGIGAATFAAVQVELVLYLLAVL